MTANPALTATAVPSGGRKAIQTSRGGIGVRLADLARLRGQIEPCANRPGGVGFSGLDRASDDGFPEERQPYMDPSRLNPSQERRNKKASASRYFFGFSPSFSSFRAKGDPPPAADNIQYRGLGQPRLPRGDGQQPVLLSGDPHDGDDFQAAENGEAYGGDDFYDVLPSPRWRNRVGKIVPVLAAAALAGAVLTAGVLPMLPPLMNPENGPSKNTPDFDSAQPRDSTKAKASAGSSEKFASRWLADIQKQPKTASISSNLSAPPRYGLGSGATLPPPTPLWAAPSSEPKKIRTVIIRSDGSVQIDSSTTAGPYNTTSTMAPQSRPSGAAAAPAIGSPPSWPVPEGGAISPPSRLPVVAGNAAEAYSGKAYAVQVASERSAAEAHASFRTLQARFPNQLGGREPIVSRTDLGADGILYRAMVGPFASMEEAAGVCSTLKAAGGSCHVERD